MHFIRRFEKEGKEEERELKFGEDGDSVWKKRVFAKEGKEEKGDRLKR